MLFEELPLAGVGYGCGGFYFATRTPRSGPMKPTSPTNIAMLFKSGVDANSLYFARDLMTPLTENSFTTNDLKAVRKYVGVGTNVKGAASFDNYEVITFGTNKPITLWLVPPVATMNHMWAIQRITESATLTTTR